MAAVALVAMMTAPALAQETPQAQETYEPTVGQQGKDVIWVPTPPALVERMLDIAKVGPGDLVMDLGSGDGRNIIAAARRGARAIGVEYNDDLVAYSARQAAAAGVGHLATFVKEDMYAADISKATVMALFLLPSNLETLTPKFLDLQPGSRIVANTFAIPNWEPDQVEEITGDCASWCKALLWIVPAKVHGPWVLGGRELVFNQAFQKVTGTLGTGEERVQIFGTLRADEITFTASNDAVYRGRVNGDRMEGTVTRAGESAPFVATRP